MINIPNLSHTGVCVCVFLAFNRSQIYPHVSYLFKYSPADRPLGYGLFPPLSVSAFTVAALPFRGLSHFLTVTLVPPLRSPEELLLSLGS